MHVVVMGCGRVGSTLARTLDRTGHAVAVVDQDPDAFLMLGHDFGGRTVVGVGFDRDRLREAGIEQADAFAAVSSGDNSNILSARVARETFAVPVVVARIYDQRRAEVYERLGIPTVASVPWQTERIMRRLLPSDPQEEWRSELGTVAMLEVPIPPGWLGERVSRLEAETGARVAYLSRLGRAVLPGESTVIQTDDLVHVLVPTDRRADIEARVAAGPEAH